MNPSTIPVGTATKAGLTGAAGSFALAIAALATGDHSSVVVTALVTSAVSLLGTMAGRYAQAVAKASTVSNHVHNYPPAPEHSNCLSSDVEPVAPAEPFVYSGLKGTMSVELPAVTFGVAGGSSEPYIDDDDLPAAGELPETKVIPLTTAAKTVAASDQGDAGKAHVALIKAEGGRA